MALRLAGNDQTRLCLPHHRAPMYLSNALLDMAKLPLSDDYFEKAMRLGAGSFPYYHRAATLARIGETDRAFTALQKAVELGGHTSRKAYESDPALAPLHPDARCKLLLEKLK